MKPKGIDMGDYEESYKGFDLEVAIEQLLTGIKAHYRVLKADAVVLDWRLVRVDAVWPTEHSAAEAALVAARAAVDQELVD
ncbi:hypothetical protein [Trinickia fusca]|uniref:Uncharacterized protein n=1 Tax=Trinickia fusca TaxID=2419777 RepID=A0A494XNW8_9BURK|nr:hypothetical protein [Trinickia fusca]RKP52357.1 hypothetical protein D7S89_02185 [Trinickia fusca]